MKKALSAVIVFITLTFAAFPVVRIGCAFEDLFYLPNDKIPSGVNFTGFNPQIEFTIYKNFEGMIGLRNESGYVGTDGCSNLFVDTGFQYQLYNSNSHFFRVNTILWFCQRTSYIISFIPINFTKGASTEIEIDTTDYPGNTYIETNGVFGKTFTINEDCRFELFTSLGIRFELDFVPIVFKTGVNFSMF